MSGLVNTGFTPSMSVENTDLESALCALWLLEELLFELAVYSKLCDVSVLANSCTLSAASLSKPRYGCCPMDWAAEFELELELEHELELGYTPNVGTHSSVGGLCVVR